MSAKSEALRHADKLDAHEFDEPHGAAAELRRLAAVEAQRDALLEALKLARPYIRAHTSDGYRAEVKADAAIKQAEENT